MSLSLRFSTLFLDLGFVLVNILDLVYVLLDFNHEALYALHFIGIENRRFDQFADWLFSRSSSLAVACSQTESLQLIFEHRQDSLERLIRRFILLQLHLASTLLEDGRVQRLLVLIGELSAESFDLIEVFEG